MRAAALALLALATVWPRWWPVRWAMAAVAGGLLVASVWDVSFVGWDVGWAAPVAVCAAVALWWAVPKAHERLAVPGGAWWVLLGSAAAVYACVPETDQMREVAVVLIAGGAAEVLLRRRLPAPALVAAAALVEWAALFGATGRDRALVGGLFALSPLIAVGLVRGGSRWRGVGVAVVWVAAALVMARTGGVADSLSPAVVSVAACAATAGLATLVVVRLDRS
ncbi:MAG: hypothetical protein Q7V57_17535 [Actinomycetota bacterium]|nr:hypothetical protein [Actinomycetota bacterium]